MDINHNNHTTDCISVYYGQHFKSIRHIFIVISDAIKNISVMTQHNKDAENRSKAYSQEEVAVIMEVLRMNDNNISKTSQEKGASHVTISTWSDEYHSNLPLQERLKLNQSLYLQ